jgi:hypothetical protein
MMVDAVPFHGPAAREYALPTSEPVPKTLFGRPPSVRILRLRAVRIG